MGRFRKRPIVIEAEKWDPSDEATVERMRLFLWNAYFNHGGLLRITTLEGVMEARAGDWIIRGVKGEFYPIKDEIFRETYESVSAPTSVSDGS